MVLKQDFLVAHSNSRGRKLLRAVALEVVLRTSRVESLSVDKFNYEYKGL